jgi:hypothetical protein
LEEEEKGAVHFRSSYANTTTPHSREEEERQRISFDCSSFYSNAANVKGKEKCWMGRFDISL